MIHTNLLTKAQILIVNFIFLVQIFITNFAK